MGKHGYGLMKASEGMASGVGGKGSRSIILLYGLA